jgi:hypothetical protein
MADYKGNADMPGQKGMRGPGGTGFHGSFKRQRRGESARAAFRSSSIFVMPLPDRLRESATLALQNKGSACISVRSFSPFTSYSPSERAFRPLFAG